MQMLNQAMYPVEEEIRDTDLEIQTLTIKMPPTPKILAMPGKFCPGCNSSHNSFGLSGDEDSGRLQLSCPSIDSEERESRAFEPRPIDRHVLLKMLV
jgi:hypothetical protein